MPVLIFVMDNDIRVVELPQGTPVFLGRSSLCDICITSPRISRRHAVFLNDGGVCGVKDLGSVNGVQVNGVRLDKTAILHDNDIVGITKYQIKFKQSFSATERREKPAAVSTSGSATLRLPRAMSVTGRLDDIDPDEVHAEPASGDDTRVYSRERRTESVRLTSGKTKSRTTMVVKGGLSDKYTDDYIARSLGLDDVPDDGRAAR